MLKTLCPIQFSPELAYHIGIEREYFITDADGKIVPAAKEVLSILPKIPNVGEYSYELSACQIELKSVPCKTLSHVQETQHELEEVLDTTLQKMGLSRLTTSVASANMPLDVYKDPSGRYARLVANMPREILQAACQITGTHVHIGMPDSITALHAYNQAIAYCEELNARGDNADGKRLELYQLVAPNCLPVAYTSWKDFCTYANQHGFGENLQNCWHLIRLTRHGTIEFRNFGATNSINTVIEWATVCRNLCIPA